MIPTILARVTAPRHGANTVGAAGGTTAAMTVCQSTHLRLTQRYRCRRPSGGSYRFGSVALALDAHL